MSGERGRAGVDRSVEAGAVGAGAEARHRNRRPSRPGRQRRRGAMCRQRRRRGRRPGRRRPCPRAAPTRAGPRLLSPRPGRPMQEVGAGGVPGAEALRQWAAAPAAREATRPVPSSRRHRQVAPPPPKFPQAHRTTRTVGRGPSGNTTGPSPPGGRRQEVTAATCRIARTAPSAPRPARMGRGRGPPWGPPAGE